ncbi:MAG TPA: diheme cytochrome c-553 [Bacteroidota bacterium]|nr:diheme cytochrome c-553 [Bacteroidota bacterium]
MRKPTVFYGLAALGLTSAVLVLGISPQQQAAGARKQAQIKRGEYLTHAGGCNDCHSPKVFVKMGEMVVPMPDTSRLLSGYPADTKLPPVPEGVIAPDKWGGLFSNDLTAWAGPWGVSFTRNITPDVATGIGSWTEEMFIKTIRTGKHMGEGRDLLPPMPWPEYAKLSDDDLKAIFAYLQSIKPIKNAVPDPIPPPPMKK